MTNPADRTTSASASIDAAEDAFALHDLRIRLRRFASHRMLLVLDLVAIALIAAMNVSGSRVFSSTTSFCAKPPATAAGT